MDNLNAYRDNTIAMCKEKGWDRVQVTTLWLLLTEEFGELASAIRQHQKTFKKKNLKKPKGTDIQMEMGDVFSYLFQLAGILEIDLDEMWNRHRVKVIQRNYV